MGKEAKIDPKMDPKMSRRDGLDLVQLFASQVRGNLGLVCGDVTDVGGLE